MSRSLEDLETPRLAALERYRLVNPSPEAAFDDLARLAARVCGAPIGAVAVVGRTHVSFLGRLGLSLTAIPREGSFCSYAVTAKEPFIVRDAARDQRFGSNRLVVSGPRVRFYAGIPLVIPGGAAVGALGVLDHMPRTLDRDALDALEAVARQTLQQLEVRRLGGMENALRDAVEFGEALRASDERFQIVASVTSDAVWDWNLATSEVAWNQGAQAMFGYARDELGGDVRGWLENVHPEDKDRVMASVRGSIESGRRFWTDEYRYLKADGSYAVVFDRGYVVHDDAGKPVRMIGAMLDITERRRADDALRASERRFRALIENSSDGIALLDDDATILYVSPATTRITGYDPGEACGRTVLDFVHPDDRKRVGDDLRAVVAKKGSTGRIEARVLNKGGSYRSIEGVVTNMLDDPSVRAIVNNFRDVTDRAIADNALRESEARFRALYDDAPVGYHELDTEGKIVRMNRTELHMLGYEASEVIGRHAWEFVPEPEAARRRVAEKLEGVEPPPAQERIYVRKNGSLLEALIEERLLHGPDGRVVGIRTTVEDISERKRAERELFQARERLRFLISSAPAVIYSCHSRGDARFTFVSDNVEAQLGYAPREILDEPSFWTARLHPEDRPRVLEEFQRLPVSGKQTLEYRFRHKNGRYRWVRDELKLVGGPSGADEIVGYWTDITERKELEQQLRHSQKMEAVGRLAGGVAHDFNNLLTAILGYSELLLADLTSDHKLREEVEAIRKAGERASSLTRQLLAFSRKQVLQPRVLNLNEIVVELEKILRRLIGEDIELETRLDPGLGTVLADPSQIEQVVMNLAVNSRDAMPQGGKLSIETRNVQLGAADLEGLAQLRPGKYILIAIADTGSGMDAETQSHIFEPFFTTKGVGKGTGLGLSTVYGIVQQSGGDIAVASALGRGTTVRIYLPRAVEAPAMRAAGGAKPRLHGSETVLLVEDEDAVRAFTRRILESFGYTVLESRCGSDALVASENHNGPIHLILTDVVMPGMSGRELAQCLKRLRAETKVLYMSGYTDDALLRHGALDHGTMLLSKPFGAEDLARKVREALDPTLHEH